MNATTVPVRPAGLRLVLSWARIRTVLFIAVPLGLMLGAHWNSGPLATVQRTVLHER